MRGRESKDSTMSHSHLPIHAVIKFMHEGKEQTRWTRVGVLLPHKQGEGFTVKLDLLPTNLASTDLVALPPKEREEE
jgi:hypothetical protein